MYGNIISLHYRIILIFQGDLTILPRHPHPQNLWRNTNPPRTYAYGVTCPVSITSEM